jgi:hypothetical protein
MERSLRTRAQVRRDARSLAGCGRSVRVSARGGAALSERRRPVSGGDCLRWHSGSHFWAENDVVSDCKAGNSGTFGSIRASSRRQMPDGAHPIPIASAFVELVLRCAKGCGAPTPRAVNGTRWTLPVSMDREREMRSSGEAARSIAAPRAWAGMTGLVTKSPVRADGEHGCGACAAKETAA